MSKKKLLSAFIIFIFFAPLRSIAQRYNEDYHDVTLSADYSVPFGKLGWVYKPTIGAQAGYNWVTAEDDKINKKGFVIGYMQLKQKADTLYYLVAPSSYGTAVFSDYHVFTAAFHIENIKAFNKFGISAGGNAGLAFVQYSSRSRDINFDTGEDSFEGKLIISPQVGINYEFTQNLSASFIAQYNALISLGSKDPESAGYNSNAGTYRQYGSLNLRMAYAF